MKNHQHNLFSSPSTSLALGFYLPTLITFPATAANIDYVVFETIYRFLKARIVFTHDSSIS